MPTYNFTDLSPYDFEILSRDLIQARDNVIYESFTTGKDCGIDFRYTKNDKNNTILQVKRYKDYRSLYNALKKEVTKVKQLNPEQYILTTSVGLTPQNKQSISDLFYPFIKGTDDILGKDDLNNLLGLYPNIEILHNKLWLSSTNVLQSILHKRTNLWSKLELEHIHKDIKLYVYNDSYNTAYEKLKKFKYVIISGIPGIGKTTLARMLVYNILANGYDDFYYISSNIEEALDVFEDNRKQIFLYDDFLGSNIFDPCGRKFDQNIISFIEKVQHTKDKYIIFTTREYILSDAKQHYERFERHNLNIAKCTIDLESYTNNIKAQILYNHIANAEIPQKYIDEFLKNKIYWSIITHLNFNPRIIEAYILNRSWEKHSINNLEDNILEYFNKPYSIWEYSFKSLSKLAQYSLFVLLTIDGNVSLNDWEKAVQNFIISTKENLDLNYDLIQWNATIKTLSDCFIKVDRCFNIYIVNFHNPSIKDFLCSYLSRPEYQSIIGMLLNSSIYVEQLYSNFYDGISDDGLKSHSKFCIKVEPYLAKCIITNFHKLHTTKQVCRKYKSYNSVYHYIEYDEFQFLYRFIKSFPKICKEEVGLIEQYVTTDMLLDETIEFSTRLEFINSVSLSSLPFNTQQVIMKLSTHPMFCEDYIAYVELLNELDYIHLLDKNAFIKQFHQDIQEEIKCIGSISDADDLISNILYLMHSLLSLDFNYADYVDDKIEEILLEEENNEENNTSLSNYISIKNKNIDEMFLSLGSI